MSFPKSTLGLLFNVDVVETGVLRERTATGTSITVNVVLDTLKVREERREKDNSIPKPSYFAMRALKKQETRNEMDLDDALAPERKVRREQRNGSRAVLRAIRKHNVNNERHGDGSQGDPLV